MSKHKTGHPVPADWRVHLSDGGVVDIPAAVRKRDKRDGYTFRCRGRDGFFDVFDAPGGSVLYAERISLETGRSPFAARESAADPGPVAVGTDA